MENSSTSFRRRIRAALCAAMFASAIVTVTTEPAAAQYAWSRKKPDESVNARQASRKRPDEIRLNFFQADWKKVLSSVCEQGGSELVMDIMPPGRFTRYDRKRYSQKEAVRILNRELEPKGFRLLEKSGGRFIDVMRLRDARSEYYRPEISKQPRYQRESRNDWSSSKEEYQKPQRAVHQISGRRDMRNSVRQAADVNRTFAGPKRSPVFDETTKAMESFQKAQLQPKKKAAPEATITRVIQPRSRRAVDIARLIYNELKDRAELADRGPSGLPAFNVLDPEATIDIRSRGGDSVAGRDPRVKFSIGIDSSRNELVIDAPPALNHSVGEMIRYLDSVTIDRGDVLRLVSTNTDSKAIARALSPQIQLLAQNNAGGGNQPAKKSGEVEKTVQPGGGALPAQLAAIAIRGRVVIQYVQGVGLVVRGNQDDVDAVISIIKELDRQARLTTPNIQLHMLRFVNSQAMSVLLAAVYQQLNTIRTGGTTTTQTPNTIAFIPVVRPNALLILASEAELKSVMALINDLDRPVDPEKEYRVFPIKYAVASQVVANITALFQAQAAAGGAAAAQNQNGLAVRVRAIADVRTNSVIIEAPPNDMSVVAGLIQKFDQEHIPSVSRIRVFPLKNATADDLQALLNTAIQSVINPPTITGNQGGGGAGGASSQQLRDAKSAVLEFMSSTGDNKRLVRSGILADIRVTSNPQANSLIVTAPETSMKMLEELIKLLDTPSKLVADIKVFNLVNGDATAMTTLLNTLFTGTNQQQGAQTVPLALADDASSGLVPLRFSVDARTNSIIAVGGTAALTVVEAVILRLDQSDSRQRRTQVIRLRNAPAADIATAINNFLTSKRNLNQIDPNLVTNLEILEREIIVVSEPITNSLLVSTTPKYEKEITELVKTLDAAPPQVIIQALLVEVELDNTDEFGIELGFQDSIFFDRGILSDIQTISQQATGSSGLTNTEQTIVSSTTTPGFNFNNQPLGSNAVNSKRIGSQALNNFSLGRVNADLGYGGLVLSASSKSISALLRALSAKRTVHVLSRPQITTLDNQTAQIHVGQLIPRVTGVTPGTAASPATPNVTDRETGIILTVTPRISPDGTIVMEVVAEKSQLTGLGVPIFTDINTGNVVESPIINLTNARSTLSIPNGQTVVMGGMITKSDDTINRKVPWLGDIPYLGYAFRYDSTSKRRTELLIFLTPRIIRNDADSEAIKQIEAERMHYIERDAERVHGPLYAVPPADGMIGTPTPMSSRFSPTSRDVVPASGYRTDGPTIRPRRDDRFAEAGYRNSTPRSSRGSAPRASSPRGRESNNYQQSTRPTSRTASGSQWDSSWQPSGGQPPQRQANPYPSERERSGTR